MPGHIGTNIVVNSRRVLRGAENDELTDDEVEELRADLLRRGLPVQETNADDLRKMITMMGEAFRDNAPVSAAQAAPVDADQANQLVALVDRYQIRVSGLTSAIDQQRLHVGLHPT